MTAPKVFTIGAGLGFADTLARFLLQQAGGDPLHLAQAQVLLPNRRACRALRDAFLRLTQGRPLLLPRLKSIEPDQDDEHDLILGGHDLPDLAPAIAPLERQLILSRLVMSMGSDRGGMPPTPDQAASLAAELAALLDSMQIEQADPAKLSTLVEDEFAAHWQVTLRFLSIVTQAWPAILAERGLMDSQDRINCLLLATAQSWRHTPPPDLVVAAGTTGSRPATAALLEVVAHLPQGMVVLPGLDQGMDQDSWNALDDQHPQLGMKRLLDRLGLDRHKVRPLLASPDPRAARLRLLSEAFRPAATCDGWQNLGEFPAATLAGVARLTAPTMREEAQAIALAMRQTLEEPGRTAALVTPDRTLAARVCAELRRWGLEIDDSAGTRLSASETGCFLRLLIEMVDQDFAPHPTLACLKHPLAAAGHQPAHFRAQVHALERACLRGPRPAPGPAGLLAACHDPDLKHWLDGLIHRLAPLTSLYDQDSARLEQFVQTHLECAEALADTPDQTGAARLWGGEMGEAMAHFAADLMQAAQNLGPAYPAMAPRHYGPLFDCLLAPRVARRPWGLHPRLFLWGPMEARLQQADLMILAGLNDGTWPAPQQGDPWMSRPMRKSFGLPSPERRIGMSALDFAQAFAAPSVLLTRSARVDGSPTVPSRWLMRLDAVMDALKLSFGEDGGLWLDWQARLDQAPPQARLGAPAPVPPVAARPRRLSVTQVETWMRDPYAVYARHVLGLTALKPIDEDPGASHYGDLVHRAIDQYLSHETGPLDLHRMLAVGRDVFAPALERPSLWAFWWPRFESVARWVIAQEQKRRPLIAASRYEVAGSLTLAGPAGPFVLHARADRIDQMKDGSVTIIDYKTGKPPSIKEVAAGFAPQLPLEGAMALKGVFDGIRGDRLDQLVFWRLKGGAQGGQEHAAGPNPDALAADALQGLAALVAVFDDPATPYAARPHPDHAPRYSDYLHLARVKEWAMDEDGDE